MLGARTFEARLQDGRWLHAAAAIWEISNALLDRQVNALSRDGHYTRARRGWTPPMVRTALLCSSSCRGSSA